jgi:uncharacterized protein YqjF (DUF2071 family)
MSAAPERSRFLTADWRHLAMLNYEIDPVALRARVPDGTELDSWSGRTFVSMVGFMFLNTKLLGVSIPCHRDFEEVNLRFYVRRKGQDGWRRGVVFIKEIVPRRAIAAVARWCYGERYASMPMRHLVETEGGMICENSRARYEWSHLGEWNHLALRAAGKPGFPQAGSLEEFITEHYWGYALQRGRRTIEYRVEHPQWRIWQASDASLGCDARALYGPEFHDSLTGRPGSAFLAEGSLVTVNRGSALPIGIQPER